MNEQNNQPHPSNSLSEDDIAAALGYTTTLSEPLLPQDQQDPAQAESGQPTDGSQPQSTAEPAPKDDKQDKILTEIEALKKEVNKDDELNQIREELHKLLQEDGQKD